MFDVVQTIALVVVMYVSNIQNLLDQTQCWIELGSPRRWQIYMSLVAVSLFVVPAIIIAACYAIIVRTIWAKGSLLMSTGKFLVCLLH